MSRTIEALRVCSNKLFWHKVQKRRLIATEACRMASNGAEFIARVAAETGLELEIIDRETEAQLAATGAEPLIDPQAESALVFDIGGGSTEVMWVERRGGRHEILAWTSLAAGVVSISERFGGGVDVTPQSFAAMRDFIRPLLLQFVAQVEGIRGGASLPSHLLGTSGTVTTIAGIQMGLRRYDRSRVDGTWLSSSDVGQVTAQLLAMTYAERILTVHRQGAGRPGDGGLRHPGGNPAGVSGKPHRVADRGLREGILTTLMRKMARSGGRMSRPGRRRN